MPDEIDRLAAHLTDYLTSPQLAAVLDVHEMTLSRWRKVGMGPEWIKVGGRFRYPRAGVQRWIEQTTTRGEHDA